MIFACIIILVSAFLTAVVGFATYQHPWETLIIAVSVVGVLAGIVGIVFLFILADKSKEKMNNNLFVQKYRAHKSKICPMVEYSNTESE